MAKLFPTALVIDSSNEEDWKKNLSKMIKENKPKALYDCVGGKVCMRLIYSLPLNSHIVIFGCESGENIHGLASNLFIFYCKTLRVLNGVFWRQSLNKE